MKPKKKTIWHTIIVRPKLKKLLTSLKKYPRESYNDVITRSLTIDNTTDTKEPIEELRKDFEIKRAER